MREEKRATWLAIIGNLLLFIGKLIVGLVYNSIAVISDAINSFTDIIASLIVHIRVIVSYSEPDETHQFGHQRAQPIAGLIVAIFIGIVGFEIISASVNRMLNGEMIQKGLMPVLLMIIVMVTKGIMFLYTDLVWRKTKSTALKATRADHRNDVLISFAVLIGVIFSNYGYPIFDSLVGIFVGLYIIKSGYDIGMENIKFLMGERPSKEFLKRIEKEAGSIKGVIGIHDVKAHYVGTMVEVEICIYVDKQINIAKAHNIGKEVQKKVERLEEISRAFIHIDPFLEK